MSKNFDNQLLPDEIIEEIGYFFASFASNYKDLIEYQIVHPTWYYLFRSIKFIDVVFPTPALDDLLRDCLINQSDRIDFLTYHLGLNFDPTFTLKSKCGTIVFPKIPCTNHFEILDHILQECPIGKCNVMVATFTKSLWKTPPHKSTIQGTDFYVFTSPNTKDFINLIENGGNIVVCCKNETTRTTIKRPKFVYQFDHSIENDKELMDLASFVEFKIMPKFYEFGEETINIIKKCRILYQKYHYDQMTITMNNNEQQ